MFEILRFGGLPVSGFDCVARGLGWLKGCRGCWLACVNLIVVRGSKLVVVWSFEGVGSSGMCTGTAIQLFLFCWGSL